MHKDFQKIRWITKQIVLMAAIQLIKADALSTLQYKNENIQQKEDCWKQKIFI